MLQCIACHRPLRSLASPTDAQHRNCTMPRTPSDLPRRGGIMADLAPVPRTHALDRFAFDADRLTLHWDDGCVGRFAAIWLRDNCPCPACRHPQAMERIYQFIDHAPPR